ncbi:MAG: hypothetical protein HIU83_15895 [Proteobacteria bacterium]|nr:hypothetical protein [Pseudomonadota bacterium]
MQTVDEYKKMVKSYDEHWKVAFRCFIDDLRAATDLSMLDEPITLDSPQLDALFASTIEALCDEKGIEPPVWVWNVPGLTYPWFVCGLEGYKAILIAESPVQFRRRLIFVSRDFLKRV